MGESKTAVTGSPSRRAVLGMGAATLAAATPAARAALPPALGPTTGPDGLVDFGGGLANAVAFMKTLTTFGDEPVFGGLTGIFYGMVGETMTPMFGYAGYRYHQSRLAPQSDGTRQLQVRGKEAGCYTDLASGQRIEHWRNPWTGEMVETPPWLDPGRVTPFPPTRDAANFTVGAQGVSELGGALRKPVAPDAPPVPFRVGWRRAGHNYLGSSDSSNRFSNPVTPAGWPRASTGDFVTQHELLKLTIDARTIDDPTKPHAPFAGVLTRNIPWLPFIRMGGSGITGRMIGLIQIYKFAGTIDDVPAPMRRFLEHDHPEMLTPMSSWEFTHPKPGGTWQYYARTTPPETPGYEPG